MSNDKFGDKLRDKEKAEEDLYFAKESREKLAKLREQADDEEGDEAGSESDEGKGDEGS